MKIFKRKNICFLVGIIAILIAVFSCIKKFDFNIFEVLGRNDFYAGATASSVAKEATWINAENGVINPYLFIENATSNDMVKTLQVTLHYPYSKFVGASFKRNGIDTPISSYGSVNADASGETVISFNVNFLKFVYSDHSIQRLNVQFDDLEVPLDYEVLPAAINGDWSVLGGFRATDSTQNYVVKTISFDVVKPSKFDELAANVGNGSIFNVGVVRDGNEDLSSYPSVLIVKESSSDYRFVSKTKIASGNSLRNAFNGYKAVTEINFNGNLDTTFCETFYATFNDCNAVVSLDLYGFDTSKATDMSYMFKGCSTLKYLDLSEFDTSNVNSFSYMFDSCTSLVTVVSEGFDLTSHTSSINMFYNCYALEGAIPYAADCLGAGYANPTTGYFTHIGVKVVSERNGIINPCAISARASDTDPYRNITVDVSYPYSKFTGVSIPGLSGNFYSASAKENGNTRITLNYKFINNVYNFNGNKTITVSFSDKTVTDNLTVYGDRLSHNFATMLKLKPLSATSINTNVTTINFISDIATFDGLIIDNSKVYSVSDHGNIKGQLIDDNGNVTVNIVSRGEIPLRNSNGLFGYFTNLRDINFKSYVTTHYLLTGFALFREDSNLTSIDLSYFDTSRITDMRNMFYLCKNLTSLDLSSFNTSNVTNMQGMFYNCISLNDFDVSVFNTTKTTDMSHMFDGCSSLTSMDLSNFDTRNVINMTNMFASTGLQTIYSPGFNLTNVTDSSNMFLNSTSLNGAINYDSNKVDATYANPITGYFAIRSFGTLPQTWLEDIGIERASGSNLNNVKTINFYVNATAFAQLDASSSDVYPLDDGKIKVYSHSNILDVYSKETILFPTNSSKLFSYLGNVTSINFNHAVNTTDVTDMSSMFSGDTELVSLKLSMFDASNVTNTTSMFENCTKMVSLELPDFSSGSLRDTYKMFYYNSNLTSLDISKINTTNVIRLAYMFNHLDKLQSLDVSNMNTSNVTGFSYLFANDYALQNITGIDNWNTSKVTKMQYMFNKCYKLQSLNFTSWNTSKVTNMAYMFSECRTLTDLNLSNFNTSNVKTFQLMFYKNYSLTSLKIDQFNTTSATNMSLMFAHDINIPTLNLTGWVTDNVTELRSTFANCTSLSKIYAEGFNTTKVTNSSLMFLNCTSLSGIISYDENKIDDNYANPFDGYFTSIVKYDRKIGGIINPYLFAANSSDPDALSIYVDIDYTTSKFVSYTFMGVTENATKHSSNSENLVIELPASFTRLIHNEYNGLYPITFTFTDKVIKSHIPIYPAELSQTWAIEGKYKRVVSGTNTTVNTINFIADRYLFNNYTIDNTTVFDVSGNENVILYKEGSVANIISRTNILLPGNCANIFSGFSSLTNFNNQNVLFAKNVVNAAKMFSDDTKLVSLNLSMLDASHVTNTTSMFENCKQLVSLELPDFSSGSLKDTSRMFFYNSNLTSLDISKLNTTNVINMRYMFYHLDKLKSLDVSNMNTSSATDFQNLFAYDYALKNITGIENWNTSQVTTMSSMFSGCRSIVSLDLSSFNTAKVKSFSYTFYNLTSISELDVSNFNTSAATNMTSMFERCSRLVSLDLSNFNTTIVTSMSYMFKGCSNLTSLNLTNFSTSKVTSMSYMFYGCSRLVSLDLSNFNTSNVTSMSYMFYDCSNLTNLDINNFNTTKVIDMSYMFNGCSNLTNLDISNFNTSNVNNMSGMFRSCSGLVSLDLSNFNTSKVNNMYAMFCRCSNLTSLNLSSFNTNKVNNMQQMFESCSGLVSLDLSNFNTSIVSSMYSMFDGCSNLTNLDISNFNTTIVTSMSYMFYGCSNLTSLNLSSFNTNKVTSMSYMFDGCSGLVSLDLSNFNTSNVTSMAYMFDGCSNLTNLDIRNFNTSKVTSMLNMFDGCSGLVSLDLTSFNTSKVTSMSGMFEGCSGLVNLDLSNFNTSNVTSMSYMFDGCSNLTNLDISNFNTTKVSSIKNLFNACSNLTSLDLSTKNFSKVSLSSVTFYDNAFSASGLKYIYLSDSAVPIARRTLSTDDWWDMNTGIKYTKSTLPNGAGNYTSLVYTISYVDSNTHSVIASDNVTKNGSDYILRDSLSIVKESDTSKGNVTFILNGGNRDGNTSNINMEFNHTINYTLDHYNDGVNNYNPGYVISNVSQNYTFNVIFNETFNSAGVVSTPNGVTRDGYNLVGWNTDSEAANGINGEFYPDRNNITLYAIWSPKQYTITFNGNTGGTPSPTSKSVIYASVYGDLATVSKTGYNFDGWYTKASGGNKITSSTTVGITANQTLYAHWSAKTFTVTFNSTGGTEASYTKTETYDSNYVLPSSPTKTGYTFGGWFTAASGGTEVTTSTKVQLSTNQTLYAHWSQNNYTVTYEKNGGTSTNANKIVTYHKAYGTLDTPTKTGYTFGGWYKEEGFTNAVTSTTNVTTASNHNIYAKWTANKYEVTFNSTGGTPEISKLNETYDSNYVLPSNPTRSGYTFDGWFTAASGGTKVTTSTKVQITGATTLYAHWSQNTYTVTYVKNGGTSTNTNKTVTYHNAYGTLDTPSKTGYTFKGWYKESTFTNKVESSTNVTTASNHNIYAKWTANKYEVTFNSTGGTPEISKLNETYDSNYVLPSNPTRSGYTFAGWFTSASGGTEVTTSTKVQITGVQTLYAHWTTNSYTLTFDGNGATPSFASKSVAYGSTIGTLPTISKYGYNLASWKIDSNVINETTIYNYTGAKTATANWAAKSVQISYKYLNGDTTTVSTKNINFGSPYILENGSKTGYTFNGWYLDSGLTNKITNGTTLVANETNHNVYSKYTPNTYVVTFNSTGGTSASYTKNETYDSNYVLPSNPTKVGYTFAGWWTQASGGTQVTTSTVVKITSATTLYAHWNANGYTVTFNSTGGSTPDPASKSVTYASTYGTLPTVTKTGHTFSGWYTQASGGTKITSSSTVSITNNQTLYAQWSANNYTVTFNGNTGGTPSPTSKIVTYASVYGELATVSKTGYNFDGWYTKASGGNKITSSTTVGITANQTLYAHWSAKTFTVTFNSTGGTEASYTKTETYDANYTLPSSPTKTGYTFGGWFTAASGGTEVTTSTKVQLSTNQTLYAHWSANTYTVTFNGNNGGTPSPTSKNVTYASTYGDLATVSRTGYDFAGWWTLASGGNQVTSSTPVSITANQTLYAHWSAKTFTVTFNSTGGTEASYTKSETYDANYTLPSSPTRSGYTFAGWFTAVSGGTEVTTSTKMTTAGAHTLYAHWSANGYTVTYNANGGTTANVNKPITYGEAYGTLDTPTRSGYTFVNWYKESSFTNVVNSATIVSDPNSHTIYAKWSANKYEVTFDPNGGSPSSKINETYDSNYALPSSNPTLNGYTFKGWYTAASGGSKVTASTNMTTASAHTLYARWSANNYTVTYNATGGTVSPANKTVTYHSAYGTLATPSRTGYTFKGWYKESGYTNVVNSTTNVTTASNHNIYAKWSANNYTVTLDMNMTGLTNSSITVTYDKAYNYYGALASPSKSGYTFGGWYDGDTRITGTEIYNKASNSVLHARWTQNTYTVTYNATGGTVSPASKTVTYHNTYGTLATPSKTGYTFKGWYKESTFTNKVESSTNVTTASNHNIYAKWSANNYTVTLDMNMTGLTNSSITVTYDKAYNYYGALASPSKSGYTFGGWYDGDTRITGTEIYNKDSNSVLHARWTQNTYTVTYNATGGTVSPTNITVTFNNAYGTLATPSRTGYTFNGWYKESGYTNKIESTTIVSTASNHNIYAKWTANNYTVTLNSNMTGVSDSVITVTYDKAYNYYGALPKPTKTGFTFLGWYDEDTNISGTEIYRKSSNSILNGRWSANSYTLTYNATGGEVSPTSKSITFNSTYGTLATPSRTGYTFKGWFNSTSYTNEIKSDTLVSKAESHTIYAKWSANQYTVTLDADGGSAEISSVTATYDSVYPNLGRAMKSGYTFVGWYDGSTNITSTTVYKTAGAKTLKAHYEANGYTVTYNATGGEVSPQSKGIVFNSTYGELATPSRSGYSFENWYKEIGYVNVVTSTTRVTDSNSHYLYAKWIPKVYTVTFDADGGVADMNNKTVTFDANYGTLASANKTGYTFDGWYDGSSKVTSTTKYRTEGNTTLKARWTAKTYTVTYKYKNADTNETDTKTVTYNGTYGSLITPVKRGYTFLGWYKESTFSNKVTSSTKVTTPNNHDLYSKFTANQYTVTFNYNGGSGNEGSRLVNYDGTYGTLPTANRTGYTFDGWFDENDIEVLSSTVYKVDSNSTLKAKWSVNQYTVTFKYTNGDLNTTASKVVTYNKTYGTLESSSKIGYTFGGWYLENNHTTLVTDSTIVATPNNHDLYSKFTANQYTVTFDAAGGTSSEASRSIKYDAKYGNLPTASKTGYTFIGWFDSSDNQITNNTVYKTTGNTILTAHYSVNSYTVTLNPGAGSVSPGTITVTYYQNYGTIPTPSKSGYTFEGWYRESSFNNKVSASTNMTTSSDHTLYANYVPNDYLVTFDPKGGSANKQNKTVTYDKAYGELATVSKTGYTFLGWYDGSTQVTNNTIYRNAYNTTLDAKWSANSYNVTFKYIYPNNSTTSTKVVTYDSAYGTLPNAERSGYTFNGWYKENTYVNKVESSTIVNTNGAHDLYSKFSANQYTVTFNYDGGSGNKNNMTVTYDQAYGELATASKTGYTFLGWYDGETEVSSASIYRTAGNKTLKARWSADQYTLTYKYLDADLNTTGTKGITFNAAYGTLANAVKRGYTFNGWYLENTYVNQITASSIVNIDRSHDVYSKFTPNVYNVSFNANNGGTNPGAQNVTFDSTYGSLPSVSKTGYTFDGWYDNGTKVSASTVYKNNYNTTLEAKWINNNYTITYKYTDGVSATSTKTVTYHKTYGELASASRTGYTFNGWYLDTTLNNRIYSTSNVTTSSNHNLYSKFTPNNYTVTYNANGGSASANNKTVTYDSAYGTLASATRSGYTFLGWYDGANKVTESTVYKTAGDKTLIAHWSSNNYTVTFMYTNGVNATSSKTVTYHQLYGELANASRTGYTFGGWYLNSDLSNRVYNSTNVTTANNHNLYSKFTPNVYTVTFDPNGGTSSLNSKSVTYDSPYGEMPSASRAGYNFVGWFDGETNVTSITTYKTASNKTLIAHWENSKYTLTYEYVNADTNTTDSKTITYNKTYGSLANATKRGYTFNGWYFDNVTFNNKVEESSIVNRTYSHSVYSKFTANTYTINFNANGGSVSPSSKTVVFDSAFGSLPTPVWSGHSFTGWGYNDTIYEQSDIYKYDRNITLVAQWDVNHYKVTLDDNYPGGSSRNVTVTYGQSYSLGTTSRTGYTFTGWYEGDVKINSIGNYTWAEDKHFDAHYNPNNYVVTLNPNSGDVTPNTVTVTYDSSYANLPSPVRSGYTFAGWYKENTFVNKIENSTIVKTASGHTLYAKWDVNSYNVTFRYKNADTLETENKVVTYDSPYGSLLTPVKRGYSFAGWYKEDTFVNRVYSNTTVKTASDHDLYSKFTVNNYTISYKANGGSPVPGNRNITYDTDYATLPVISKTGYTFNGWYDNGIKVSTSTRFLNDYDTELEARWSANNYTVTFDSDGGSTPESSRIIAYDSAYGTLPVPSKTGRTFAGWFDNGTEVTYSTIYKHTNNITLVAQWTDVGYTVTFKYVDDDEKVTSTKNVAYGRKYGALPNGTKVGYTFMGWFKESSYENLVTEDTIVDVAGSHELYSLYRANEYTISFNPNGGYYVANRTIIYDTLYGVLTPTSKSGYTFIGWYDGEDNITPDTEYKNPYNTTLNAHYVQNNYTVTLNSMGGNCNISLFNVTYDEHYGYIPDPVRSGYTFMGWYDSTGWINRVTSETTVRTASDHTLYAKWSANTYTVTFDGNQGSVSQNNKTVIYDEVYGSLATATRNGYTFKGWFDGSKNITASTNYTNAYDTTLVAHFEANNYTVTYKYIDGVSATSTKKVTYDKAYGTLYEAVRRGYTFNGWYLENTYEHKVTNETIVKTYSNHDLYSKFSVNSYNITFDYKGGHGSKNSMIATFDDAYSDLPGASRTGYTFLGWYDNGTLVNNSTIYKNDYDTTLEARWSANDYGVTFKYKNADTNETAYKSVVFNSTYGTLSNATKIGYTFENWYLEDTFNNVITSESIVLTPNSHDLYSKFIPNNYTISFNYNGGVIGEVSRNITFDSKYNSLPSTERSGYTFLGWYDRETRVSVLTTYKNPHNTTLIAKWDDNDYTVTFKYVDADNNITNTKGVTYDRAYGELYNAVKTGYTFAGWYKESTYVNRVNDNTTVKSAGNHDLYSKFTPNNYTVTFDYNEGSGSEASRVVTYDNKYGILPVASRVGHTFVGWYDGSTNVTKDTIYKTVGDKTLVAHYEANNYTVTLNPLEGSVTPNHITVTYGQDYGLIPDAERSGYTFNDWYKEGTFINKVNATTNVTTASGHTLYAKYSANSYTVTFDYNGGAQGISNKTVIYDSGYDVLPNTSKVGYTFIGWYDGSDKVTSSTIYKNAYNTTLTAHYTKNKYVVTLNPLDGSVVNNKKNVTFDEPYGYLENASRIGYTFDNWYKEETFDNVINSTIVVKTASNHTLYANYINNNYTVTFDYRGGSGNVSSKTVTFDMAYGDLPECTREGYTFKGWYDGSNLVNNETIYHTDGNITLKAHYAGNDYTVTYKYIDADANITSTKLVTFSEEYGTLLNATKNGYIFKGWYKESTFVNKVNESSIVNIASNHDLYSKFTPNTYKISYNPNGGNYTPEERDIVFDSAYGSLPSISRIGYIFKGWYDGSTNISVDSIYKNSHNTTLVAEWEANNYTITYKYKNDDIHETDTKVVTFNSTYGELLTGQKTGYAFGNWYLDSELSNKVTASTKVLTASDHDLYAKWNPKNYALIFNYNGGSGAIVEKTVTFDSSFGELPTPERSGYTFTNWYDEDVIVNSGTIYRTPYNKVIDAHYYANNYTVYFDGEGGSVDTVSKTVTYDSAYGSLPVPVKTGRTFYGWADGDDIVTEETIYKNASNTTLHAIWNDNIYTVTYKYIDADNNSTSTKNVYFGRGYGDLLNAQKRGYSFVGWFLEETFENEITKNTIVNTDCDHDLYSKFVQNNYTITFDANGGELEAYSMNITYDEMIGNLPVVARVGYEFVGWYINNEEINNETIYKIDNNSIAIAKWKNNQYNLMFNALEGDCDILSKIITYDMPYGDMPSANRTGYTFDGWYAENTFVNNITNETIVNTLIDQTVFAKYNINTYKITLKQNNGNSDIEKYVNYNSSINDLPSLNKVGHTFVGWYSDEYFTKQIKNGYIYEWTNDINLYAKYEVNKQVISFEGLNNTNETEVKTELVNYGTVFEVVNVTKEEKNETVVIKFNTAGGDEVETKNSTKTTSYIFSNMTNNDKTYSKGEKFIVTGDIKITVNFDEEVTYQQIELPKEVKKEGYVFLGWKESPESDVIFTDTYIPNGKDVNLYAAYERAYSYEVISGDNSIVDSNNYKDDSSNITYVIDGDYNKFVTLSIDDVILQKEVDYNIYEGSTVIVFTKIGLNKIYSLERGSHNLVATYSNNMSVNMKIIVEKSYMWILWLAIVITIILGIVIYIKYKKKKA